MAPRPTPLAKDPGELRFNEYPNKFKSDLSMDGERKIHLWHGFDTKVLPRVEYFVYSIPLNHPDQRTGSFMACSHQTVEQLMRVPLRQTTESVAEMATGLEYYTFGWTGKTHDGNTTWVGKRVKIANTFQEITADGNTLSLKSDDGNRSFIFEKQARDKLYKTKGYNPMYIAKTTDKVATLLLLTTEYSVDPVPDLFRFG